MKIEDKLIELEEKCVSKIEEHFLKYLLENVLETNGIVGLFTDEDYYLYWLTNGFEVNELIDNHIELDSNRKILLSLIKYKRIIDKQLISYKKNETEILDDLGIENHIEGTDIIKIETTKIPIIYNLLKKHNFININLDKFASYFNTDNKPIELINWNGKIKDLSIIISYLFINNIVKINPEKYKIESTKIIARIFSYKGNPIKETTIITNSKTFPDTKEFKILEELELEFKNKSI